MLKCVLLRLNRRQVAVCIPCRNRSCSQVIASGAMPAGPTSPYQREEVTPGTAVETLQVQEISQSAARQRAGRAGRERAGECYRLYTQKAFEALPLAGTPEIVRTDLAAAVLQLCAMGQDPYTFDWLDTPDPEGLQESVLQLIQLGALDIHTPPPNEEAKGDKTSARLVLTGIGMKMAMLPVSPAYSRSLIAAAARGRGRGQCAPTQSAARSRWRG